MPLYRWQGKLLVRNGKLATNANCCCGGGDGCCEGLGDIYAEAIVGTCSETGQLTREADGTYAGTTVRLWTIELVLPGGTLFIAVQCWDGGDQIRIYSDTCSGVPGDFNLYDPTESYWNVLETCTFPIEFPDRPGACYDASCGSPPLTLQITLSDSPF